MQTLFFYFFSLTVVGTIVVGMFVLGLNILLYDLHSAV